MNLDGGAPIPTIGRYFPEQVERTVSENARTLKFNDFGFEEE